MSSVCDTYEAFLMSQKELIPKTHTIGCALVPSDKMANHLKLFNKTPFMPEGSGWWLLITDATTRGSKDVLAYGPSDSWEKLFDDCIADLRDGVLVPYPKQSLQAPVKAIEPLPQPTRKKTWNNLF
jgi:hypothetical protein